MADALKQKGFVGTCYRTCGYWEVFVPSRLFEDRAIVYGEIGVFCGGNMASVLESYAKHPESRAHAIDPWGNYEGYDEYTDSQPSNKKYFDTNMKLFDPLNKVLTHQGLSRDVVTEFEDETFDILYIDGNHRPHYVLEDAVLYFRKVKVGGYMIFDDYGWNGDQGPKKGVDSFLQSYSGMARLLTGPVLSQVFIQKIAPM